METKIIKPGEWSKKNNAIFYLKEDIVKKTKDKDLPKEIIVALEWVLEKINNLKTYKAESLIELRGKTLTGSEIKSIVEDSTGYKWNVSNWTKKNNPFDKETQESIDYLIETYGVNISKKNVVGYVCARDAKTRDELNTIEMLCMPGYVFFEWGTGRACGYSSGIIPNDKLKKELERT